MHVAFVCPKCERPTVEREPLAGVRCRHCGWARGVPENAAVEARPTECLVCGCGDLWRQKDFPVRLGLLMVGLGALGSTVAWMYYEPLWAIGILMAFALVDLLLFLVMPDVLVCYRCEARHRDAALDESVPHFNLEIAEKYRQEQIRLRETNTMPIKQEQKITK
jgi:hypothetical protein